MTIKHVSVSTPFQAWKTGCTEVALSIQESPGVSKRSFQKSTMSSPMDEISSLTWKKNFVVGEIGRISSMRKPPMLKLV